MELGESTLKSLVKHANKNSITEEHILVILYNILCAINFIHSANIIHRDLKPDNLLIDRNCQIKLCDFGLARNLPKLSKVETEIKSLHKKHYKQILKSDTEEKRISR